MIDVILTTLSLTASGMMAVYGLHLYVLLYLSHRNREKNRHTHQAIIEKYQSSTAEENWPVVTTQIPLYNEREVAARVIDAVAMMDYPAGRHELQILDDSNDGTQTIVDRLAAQWQARGVDVKIVRRPDRSGFKAGALSHGLRTCRGDLVAIFDSDFVPPVDFLRRSVPLIVADEKTACVQGRWEHLNENESWLTRAQALGIDGHFIVEQPGRCWAGLVMNFNGTAGIWRKAAIDDPRVGGWQGDTLTEDLDLSYRAYMAGWKMEFCPELACPSEIPADVKAFKSQQRRWATGSIQVARKLLPNVWRSELTLGQKIEATLHLTYYSVSIWMLMVLLVAQPMIFVRTSNPSFWDIMGKSWVFILFSAGGPPVLYIYARRVLRGDWGALARIPLLMLLGMGACLDVSLAVIKGLFMRGGEFVRTPKSGSVGEKRVVTSYAPRANRLWFAELVLSGYALVCVLCYSAAQQWMTVVFLSIYCAGLFVLGWSTRPETLDLSLPTAPFTPRRVPDVSAA